VEYLAAFFALIKRTALHMADTVLYAKNSTRLAAMPALKHFKRSGLLMNARKRDPNTSHTPTHNTPTLAMTTATASTSSTGVFVLAGNKATAAVAMNQALGFTH
jgi:hypothetical protein